MGGWRKRKLDEVLDFYREEVGGWEKGRTRAAKVVVLVSFWVRRAEPTRRQGRRAGEEKLSSASVPREGRTSSDPSMARGKARTCLEEAACGKRWVNVWVIGWVLKLRRGNLGGWVGGWVGHTYLRNDGGESFRGGDTSTHREEWVGGWVGG